MNAEISQAPQLSTSRLLLLGLSSVVLCVSFIMSVFAPFPLALAFILYGRLKGLLTGVAGLFLTFAFASYFYKDPTLFGFYAGVLILGFGISEIVVRGIAPVKGMVIFGLSFILLMAVGFFSIVKTEKMSVEQFVITQIEKSADKLSEQKKAIEQSSQEGSIDALQILDKPELLAKEMMESIPSFFFMGVFLMIWFNMFLVLKSRRLLMSGNEYPFSERDLLNFKVPFGFVFLLVIGFVLAIWGKDLGYGHSELIGNSILKCLGIFYFFQGFGVFSDMLNFLGVMGFFRTLIVMVVIFIASYLIAVAGLFDNWFDFRKYFKKPKTED